MAVPARLPPSIRYCTIWSCRSERISSRRALRTCSGRAAVYIHVQPRARNPVAAPAQPRHNVSIHVALMAWSPMKAAKTVA